MTTADALLDVGVMGGAGQASDADLRGFDGGVGLRGWLMAGTAAVLLHAVIVGPLLVGRAAPPVPPVAPPAIELDLMPAAMPVAAMAPPVAQPVEPEVQPVAEVPPEPMPDAVEPQPVEPDPVEAAQEVVPDEPLVPDDLPVVAAAPVEVAVAKPVARPRPPRPRVVEAPRPPRPEPPPPVTRSVTPAPPTPAPPAPASPVAPVQAAAPAAPPAPPVPPNARPNFAGMLVAHLKRHQRYPRQAQRRREEGKPQVRIVMSADGSVVSVNLVQSSGHESLDEEAVALVRRAEPLPAIPPELNQSQLDVVVPISFDLH
ncbi:TonB family protein [Zavarzinia sp. CC-PAN008]|uniref:energy transducer TonB family protein n=1 Tax=Zavarzinia sp. CC-PAN008 TaxID=3243332 RepID=UPI003F748691